MENITSHYANLSINIPCLLIVPDKDISKWTKRELPIFFHVLSRTEARKCLYYTAFIRSCCRDRLLRKRSFDGSTLIYVRHERKSIRDNWFNDRQFIHIATIAIHRNVTELTRNKYFLTCDNKPNFLGEVFFLDVNENTRISSIRLRPSKETVAKFEINSEEKYVAVHYEETKIT